MNVHPLGELWLTHFPQGDWPIQEEMFSESTYDGGGLFFVDMQ